MLFGIRGYSAGERLNNLTTAAGERHDKGNMAVIDRTHERKFRTEDEFASSFRRGLEEGTTDAQTKVQEEKRRESESPPPSARSG